MNILLSTNDNYVMPTLVLLESLYDTQSDFINVYILWSDLSEESMNLISKSCSVSNGKIVFVQIDDSVFRNLPTREYISKETYFRLVAAKYLPAEIERVLWLDSDMIARRNILDFYNRPFDGNAVIACSHGEKMRAEIDDDCLKIGIPFREQYFNAGVMLCNLELWRKMNIEKKIVEILDRRLEMHYPGQDLTNLVFNGLVKTENFLLYNCMIHSLDSTELLDFSEANAQLVHFVGRAKPWDFYDLPFADEWLKIYKKTALGDQPLKLRSYFKLKQLFERVEALKNQHDL